MISKEELEKRRIKSEVKITDDLGWYDPNNREKKSMQIGDWRVSIKGDLNYDDGRYEISADRLSEEDWIAHLFSKGWIDFNDFIPAYFQACKNAGIQEVKIKIFY